MSVLVVDDDNSDLVLLKALLEEEGLHSIHIENDARHVLQALADQKPDLVLLDLHMPHLDAYDVLGQIRQFAAGSYLPVLVLTADTTTSARDRALGQGAQDYLTKPIDTTEVVLRIANLLETSYLYDTMRRTLGLHRGSAQSLGADGATRSRIEAVIRDGIIAPVYQPIVDVNAMTTVGYEGLSRFGSPTYGGPERWFADAVGVGLGVDLEWLAATTLLPILESLPPDIFVAVNLSAAAILTLVDRELCPPSHCPRVIIEITEHVPVEDYRAVHRAIAEMRSHGTRLAADDLGAGYAGFRHLLDLAPDIIKLDKSLVTGLHRSKHHQAMARAIATFAADVGATVIGEGVEHPLELEALRDLGVPLAQGFYLGRPAPARV